MTGANHLFDPQALYRQWEDSQWSPWEFDLSADRDQWEAMEDRSLVVFVLGSLMVAEERITTKFSGLVGADGSEEEVTFLATQQVDEARHMQFYARYQDEVVSEPAVIAEHVKRARAHVSPAFQTIFDDKLVAAHNRLLSDPGDRAAKVAFVTIYHQILEATLGLTTFEFATRYLQREGSSPATARFTTTSTVTSPTAYGFCAKLSPRPRRWAMLSVSKRLSAECRRLGSATYCLSEWAEPDDARADVDTVLGRRNVWAGTAATATRRYETRRCSYSD